MPKRLKVRDFFLSFSLTLVVRGKDLNLDWLTEYLEINPTQTYKPNGSENEEPLYAWYYQLKAVDKHQLSSVSDEFFKNMKDVGRKLADKVNIEVSIVLHVHAELAQVYFELPQNMIVELSQCGIPFGISIFDWGLVEK